LKAVYNNRFLSICLFVIKRDKTVGTAQVAIIFDNLILIDQVISKGIPCQFIDRPMILMKIIPVMRKYNIGISTFFNIFKPVLHTAPGGLQVAVPVVQDPYICICDRF